MADWLPGLGPMYQRYDPPQFVLYGDGRAIVREERDTTALKLVEYHLTPQRVRALFGEAADAELFDDEDYSLDEQVLDAGALVITLRTTEEERTVEIVLPNPEDSGARGEAATFAESLRPEHWKDGDFSSPPSPYRPDRVAVIYETATPNDNETPRPWPLPGTEPIKPGCALLTGTTATQTQELSEKGQRTTLWQQGDLTFHAWIRPLLPDETDCHATESHYRP
jgi:hypothetical protein